MMLEAEQSYLCQNFSTINCINIRGSCAQSVQDIRKHPLRMALQGLHNSQQFQDVNPPLALSVLATPGRKLQQLGRFNAKSIC